MTSSTMGEYSKWTLLNVYLDLSNQGLGMSIRGGLDSPDVHGNVDVYISKILPGGAVYDDGRLQLGDILVEVNGVSLQAITHKEVVQAIMKASPYLHLSVKRHKADVGGDKNNKTPATLNRNIYEDDEEDDDEDEDEPLMGGGDDGEEGGSLMSKLRKSAGFSKSNLQSTHFNNDAAEDSCIQVELQRDDNGFGLSLTGGVDNQLTLNDVRIYVSKLVHGGAAHRNGLIQEGDQVVAINGTDLQKVPYAWALQLIRSSPPRSVFTIKKALTWD